VAGIETRLSITGCGALSGMGEDFPSHLREIGAGRNAFRPLGELLGAQSRYRDLPASWIANRKLLISRKWSPASMAAVHAAREAIAAAGWSTADCREVALFLGTSRGTAAGWIDPWPERRAFPLMAASNSLHSEPAAAVSITFGIQGPWQVQASGCAAGLDALGMAWLWLASGQAKRALVVAVDLPLSPALLDSYAATGILSTTGANDPYGSAAAGMLPAEAAVAMTLEAGDMSQGHTFLDGYLANADAADPIGVPDGNPQVIALLRSARERFGDPAIICPHGSGTSAHSIAEPPALISALGEGMSICLLKPFLGHGIGGGGLLEAAVLAGFLREHRIPAPLMGLSCPPGLSMTAGRLSPGTVAYKLASSLGGKNSLVALQAP